MGPVVTEEDCIRALCEAEDRLGKSPTKAEYEELKMSPSSTTILRIMGSWNEAKEAAGLEMIPEGEGGGPPIQSKPDWVELPDRYEWTELNPQQRWYYKNREHRVAVKTRRKDELREWFTPYKRKECECSVCGETHPACLQFHHVGEKRMGGGYRRWSPWGSRRRKYSPKSILAESYVLTATARNIMTKPTLRSSSQN